jgi:thiamine biosynthesis protein ThiS
MNVTIFIEREQDTQNIVFDGTTVRELLQKLSVNPETVLTVRNSEVLTEEETVEENDRIELLSVISGG